MMQLSSDVFFFLTGLRLHSHTLLSWKFFELIQTKYDAEEA